MAVVIPILVVWLSYGSLTSSENMIMRMSKQHLSHRNRTCSFKFTCTAQKKMAFSSADMREAGCRKAYLEMMTIVQIGSPRIFNHRFWKSFPYSLEIRGEVPPRSPTPTWSSSCGCLNEVPRFSREFRPKGLVAQSHANNPRSNQNR